MTDIDIKIIRGLADNDLNVAKTAKGLYIGNRTAWTHIRKIKEEAGLNPLKFWDLIELLKMIGEM